MHGLPRLDGAALQRARRARGLSLDALAAAVGAGATRQQLIAYETGACRPDPARLAALAAALAVPPERLAGIAPCWATLADLRHWAGLTAEQAAPAFGFSRWSLLRCERTGRLPLLYSREAFLAAAADAYGRPYGIVLGALRRTEYRAVLINLMLLAPPPYFALPPAPEVLNHCRTLAVHHTLAARCPAGVGGRPRLAPSADSASLDLAAAAAFVRHGTAAAGAVKAFAHRVLGRLLP